MYTTKTRTDGTVCTYRPEAGIVRWVSLFDFTGAPEAAVVYLLMQEPVIVTTTSIFAVNGIYICVGSGGKAVAAPSFAC